MLGCKWLISAKGAIACPRNVFQKNKRALKTDKINARYKRDKLKKQGNTRVAKTPMFLLQVPRPFHIQLRSVTVSFAEQSSTDLTRGIVGLVMGFLMGIVAVLLVLLFIWWKRKQKVTTELLQLDHRL